jgi:sec-independent protein translocase protein TatB
MFGLSFSELFVIGIVALLVLGPERLPKVARTIGHLTGRAQRYMSDIKNDIQREMDIQELSKLKKDVESSAAQMQSDFNKAVSDIKDPLASIKQEMGDVANQLKQDITQELPDLSSLKPKKDSGVSSIEPTFTENKTTS